MQKENISLAKTLVSHTKCQHVLGVDPGVAKLGLSYVKWNGKDYNDESNYSVQWMCLIHLTNSFKGKEEKEEDEDAIARENTLFTDIVKYEEMHVQFDRLTSFLNRNKNLNSILKIKGIRSCIEQQEGARDINVLFRLMRINFVCGAMCAHFRAKNVPFVFVPKTYKCGWSFMGLLAKKKLEGVSKTRIGPISPNRRKALLKQYKKEATCELVRRTINVGGSPEDIVKFSSSTKNSDYNHVADSASQAVRYIKELVASGCYENELRIENGDKPLELKKTKDGVSKNMRAYLESTFY